MSWDEAEISAAISAGSPAAEAEFWRRFRPRVLRMTARALPGGPDREDLASEILQGAIGSIRKGSFRGDCRLGTFVHAVARNKIAEYRRRRRPETRELSEDIPDRGPSPEETLFREEMARAIRAVLARLKPKYRTVLFLYYFRGLSVSEIASELAVSPRQVSEWKDYAQKTIRSRFRSTLDSFR